MVRGEWKCRSTSHIFTVTRNKRICDIVSMFVTVTSMQILSNIVLRHSPWNYEKCPIGQAVQFKMLLFSRTIALHTSNMKIEPIMVLWGITDSNRLTLLEFVLCTIMAVVNHNVILISPFYSCLSSSSAIL